MKYPDRNHLWTLILIVLLGSVPAWAQRDSSQQDPSPSKETQQGASTSDSTPAPPDSTESQPSAQSPIPTNTTQPQVQLLGRPRVLPAGRVSPLQWGPLYVQSAEFSQAAVFLDLSGQPDTAPVAASFLQTYIVFDHVGQRTRFTTQYQPQLAIVGGQAQGQFANHNASLETYFQLSSRVALGLSDQYSYFGDQRLFENLDLQADISTGSLLQSRFLEGPGHYLNNRTQATLSYQLNPRVRLDFTPDYNVAAERGVSTVLERNSYGSGASLTYLISDTKNVGIYYSAENATFSRSLPRTLYQTAGASYSQRVSQTWRFATSVGVSTSGSSGNSRAWVGTGLVSLIKSFREASLAFSYYRGQDAGIQITNSYSDRLDLSYTKSLSSRVRTTLGGGYYREFLGATNTKGAYLSGEVAYLLSTTFSVYAAYAFKDQRNGGEQLFNGREQYVTTGIRWEPTRQNQ